MVPPERVADQLEIIPSTPVVVIIPSAPVVVTIVVGKTPNKCSSATCDLLVIEIIANGSPRMQPRRQVRGWVVVVVSHLSQAVTPAAV